MDPCLVMCMIDILYIYHILPQLLDVYHYEIFMVSS
jgi:hypothetical protein